MRRSPVAAGSSRRDRRHACEEPAVRRRRHTIVTAAAIIALPAILAGIAVIDRENAPAADPYRPVYHYAPARNWMNDPNGLVYLDGEYHLFYQYNPSGPEWGNIGWGHAVSRDLATWDELGLAIPGAGEEMIFSGSAVVDTENTSGFGKPGTPAMVAIYTSARSGVQAQSLAYSIDRGRTWTRHADNPVLDVGLSDFRDPKVFWYAPKRQWVMSVVRSLERKVSFYASDDLRSWRHLSDFGPAGAVGGVWECPDLIELSVEGRPGETVWMLTVSLNPGGASGGSGAQYFLGHFDGTRFTPDAASLGAFEGGGWEGWQTSGTAFGAGPAAGSLPGQNAITGGDGSELVNSFHGGDEATGTLTSPPFTIERAQISLLVGGGSGPGTAAELIVDDRVVRSAGGRDSEELGWITWDVADLAGSEARILLRDDATGPWGHLLVDSIRAGDAPLWLDWGRDYYAAVSWNSVPGGPPLMIGWMSNWDYAGKTPSRAWRGAMSVPREIRLRRDGNRLVALQRPVASLRKRVTGEPWRLASGAVISGTPVDAGVHPLDVRGDALDIELELEPADAARVGIDVRVGDGERTRIGYDAERRELFVDRSRSGADEFSSGFAGEQRAPLELAGDAVSLRIMVDRSSVEVFADDGARAISDLIYPRAESDGVALFAEGGSARVRRLELRRLR
jgi:sucrose-6-phosphate hydrolase SacC (GH32 family)